MSGQILYEVLPEIKVCLILYSGEITLDLVKSHLQKMGSDPQYDPKFDAITDFGESTPIVTNQEIEEVVKFMRSAELVIGERRQAFIFRTAKHQAISSIFSMLASDLPVTFDVVSDLRKAKEYIGLEVKNFKLISDTFLQMKKKLKH